MKRLLLSAALCAFPLSAITAPPAAAQWVVYDPANHIQSIIQAIQAVESVTNQIEQLANEIEMLENMAKDLESLPDSIADDIQRRMDRIEQLMREAEGIGYRIEEIEREYEDHYPETYGDNPPEQRVLVEEARARWEQSRVAYRDSLLTTAQVVSTTRADATSLQSRLSASQSASGNLQAVQAGNEIAALQTEQLMQIEAMMAAHYRAEALERARQLAEAERGRARTRAFLGGGSD